MKYYLGLDAGGTKTFCLIGDEQGNIKGFGTAACGSYEYYGIAPAAAENRKAVEGALAEAGLALEDISGIGMGIAGADLPEDYDMLEREIYTPLFGQIPRVFRNDSMGCLRGGTREPYGIVIACGTGCICAGTNPQGRHTRVGGLGEPYGDIVSGSSIGLRGIQAVMQARDSVIPPTLLTRKFVDRGGCTGIEDLFHKLYRNQLTHQDLQPMAKLVFDAACEGDAAAIEILEWGGRYLGLMINAVATKLEMRQNEFDLVTAGSVFKGTSPVLKDTMSAVVHGACPRARVVMPVFEPVVGTLLLGMELDVRIDETVYGNLERQLIEAGKKHQVNFRISVGGA
jgi:N-acetylglucosamine kinase-like BadF-type ATPase